MDADADEEVDDRNITRTLAAVFCWLNASEEMREKQHIVLRTYALAPLLFGRAVPLSPSPPDKFMRALSGSKSLSTIGSTYPMDDENNGLSFATSICDRVLRCLREGNGDWVHNLATIINVWQPERAKKGSALENDLKSFVNHIAGYCGEPRESYLRVAATQFHHFAMYLRKVSENPTSLIDEMGEFRKLSSEDEKKVADKRETGNKAFKEGDYEEAVKLYTEAIKLCPFSSTLYGNRAQANIRLKQPRLAISDALRSFYLEPTSLKVQWRLAQAWFDSGNIAVADNLNRNALMMCANIKDMETLREQRNRFILEAPDYFHSPEYAQIVHPMVQSTMDNAFEQKISQDIASQEDIGVGSAKPGQGSVETRISKPTGVAAATDAKPGSVSSERSRSTGKGSAESTSKPAVNNSSSVTSAKPGCASDGADCMKPAGPMSGAASSTVTISADGVVVAGKSTTSTSSGSFLTKTVEVSAAASLRSDTKVSRDKAKHPAQRDTKTANSRAKPGSPVDDSLAGAKPATSAPSSNREPKSAAASPCLSSSAASRSFGVQCDIHDRCLLLDAWVQADDGLVAKHARLVDRCDAIGSELAKAEQERRLALENSVSERERWSTESVQLSSVIKRLQDSLARLEEEGAEEKKKWQVKEADLEQAAKMRQIEADMVQQLTVKVAFERKERQAKEKALAEQTDKAVRLKEERDRTNALLQLAKDQRSTSESLQKEQILEREREKQQELESLEQHCLDQCMRARRAEASLLEARYELAVAPLCKLLSHCEQRSSDSTLPPRVACTLTAYASRLKSSVFALHGKYREQVRLVLEEGRLLTSFPELKSEPPQASPSEMAVLVACVSVRDILRKYDVPKLSLPSAEAAAPSRCSSKSDFDVVTDLLAAAFPACKRADFMSYIERLRAQRKGSLMGMMLDEIVKQVSELIRHDLQQQQEEADACIICQDEMHLYETTHLDCKHTYHTKCIKSWFKEQSTCPICRSSTLLSEDFPCLS